MALELINQSASEGLTASMISAVGSLPGMKEIFAISKAIGIVVLVYLGILILKAIIQTWQARNFKRLVKNVEEINQKLDILVGKKRKK